MDVREISSQSFRAEIEQCHNTLSNLEDIPPQLNLEEEPFRG
jgi:hypothetical protein